MILPPERLTTNVAGIRPLVGVRSLVNKEVVRFRELSTTKFTNELLLRPGRSAGCPEESPIQVLVGQWSTRGIQTGAGGIRATEHWITG